MYQILFIFLILFLKFILNIFLFQFSSKLNKYVFKNKTLIKKRTKCKNIPIIKVMLVIKQLI